VLERAPFPLILDLAAGALLQLHDRVWIRGKYRPNVITLFDHARVTVGPDSLLNGVIISARQSVTIGRNALLAWDVTILDSNLHALDNNNPLHPQPVVIGDHVWIGAGALVLPGTRIGNHSVIAAHSVVSGEIPDHALAAGSPARVVRRLADRDRAG
jgi:acetyltransferase-like isoleucine patch superfamily enzyme